MGQTAAELLKRAFQNFETIAKRDPKAPGAVEVDLGKVATEIAKSASTFGATADLEALEKSLEDIGSLLEKLTHDPVADKVYGPATELAKRMAVADETPAPAKKAADAPQYTHEGGTPKPPAKGSKEQKDNEYTAEAGLANDKTEPYTESSNASVATTPSGKDAISFDQPSSTAKAQSAKPTGTNETAAAEAEPAGEPTISENKGGRRPATKRSATAKAADAEDAWAKDMAALSTDEVADIRKAAKASAKACDDAADAEEGGEMPHESTDDRSAADAKGKKAKAKKAAPTAGASEAPAPAAEAGAVDETEKAAEDDEEAEGEGDKKPPFPPKKGEKAKTAKADEEPADPNAEVEWAGDMAPKQMPVDKVARMTRGELGAKAAGARVVAKRQAEIRKAALEDREPEEISGDELSPDQVATLRKSASLTPAQRRRANAKRLKEKGYVQGTREIDVDGIEEAAVSTEE